jgi:hypothetical protein
VDELYESFILRTFTGALRERGRGERGSKINNDYVN